MTEFHVAFAADAKYIPHSAVMLRSLAASNSHHRVEAHLLHAPDLPPACVDRLRGMLAGTATELATHVIRDERVAGLPSWDRIPTTMWFRVLLPELLPGVDRVLYVDVDTLIVDSIADLWAIDLDGFYLGAVTNVPQDHMIGHAEELGLSGPRSYFNSGVLLMNLALMRRDGRSAALLQCAHDRLKELLWPDQDTLNLVLAEHRLALHPRWNLMNSVINFPLSAELLGRAEVSEAVRRPGIVHFEGPDENKPWHVLCDNPWRGRYLEYRRQTPWPRFRPDGLTPRNVTRLARRRARALAGRAASGAALRS